MNLQTLCRALAVSILVILSGIWAAVPAVSQAAGNASLIAFEYQRWSAAGMDTRYPEDGPYVEVSATNLAYDRALDLQSDTQVLVYGYALCGRNRTRRDLSVRAGSGPEYGGPDLRGQWPWVLAVPRADFMALDPVRQCNDSASDFSRRTGRPLADILQEGFAVRIPRALNAQASYRCEGSGLRRGTLEQDSVELDAWIHCLPNATAGRARAGRPTIRAGGRDEPGPSEEIRSFAGAQVSIAGARQTVQCPASVELKAQLEFAAAGRVVAQWHASGDYRSPAQTFEVRGPGKTDIQHTLLVEPPKGSTTALAIAPADASLKGWARLHVDYEVRSEQAGRPATRASLSWNSERLDYEIHCVEEVLPGLQLRSRPN